MTRTFYAHPKWSKTIPQSLHVLTCLHPLILELDDAPSTPKKGHKGLHEQWNDFRQSLWWAEMGATPIPNQGRADSFLDCETHLDRLYGLEDGWRAFVTILGEAHQRKYDQPLDITVRVVGEFISDTCTRMNEAGMSLGVTIESDGFRIQNDSEHHNV